MSGGEVGLLTGDLGHYWVTPRLGRCPPTGQAGTVGLSGEAGPGPPRRVPSPQPRGTASWTSLTYSRSGHHRRRTAGLQAGESVSTALVSARQKAPPRRPVSFIKARPLRQAPPI